MIKQGIVTLILCMLFIGFAYGQHAHTHGVATIDFAIEDARHALVDLSAPAEDVLGFEHSPRDEQEQQREREGLERWRARVGEMLVFEKRLDCSIEAGAAEVTSAGGSGHREVRVGAEIRCQEPLIDSQLRFELWQFYSSLHEIELTVVSRTRQTRHHLHKPEGVVKL